MLRFAERIRPIKTLFTSVEQFLKFQAREGWDAIKVQRREGMVAWMHYHSPDGDAPPRVNQFKIGTEQEFLMWINNVLDAHLRKNPSKDYRRYLLNLIEQAQDA